MCHCFLDIYLEETFLKFAFSMFQTPISLVFFINVFVSFIRKCWMSLFRTVRLFKDALTGSSTKIPNLEKIQNKELIFCEFSDFKEIEKSIFLFKI